MVRRTLIGIYSITNKINGKRYIGKSINIESRFWYHKNSLMKDVRSKDTNRYLFNAVKKYGIENFSFDILESFDSIPDAELSDREIHWMDFYQTCSRENGYNLRRDSSTKTEVHPETLLLLSVSNSGEGNPNWGNFWTEEQKQSMRQIAVDRHSSGLYYGEEWRAKISEASKKIWLDEEKKARMAKAVALSTSEYRFYQYDKVSNELIRVWENMWDIMEANPDYHKIAIYSVCNGHKKSYRGFVWRKELKTR